MSTLSEEIASLERRIREMDNGYRPKCTQKYSEYVGRLRGLKQRELNHENMQIEIAKSLGWIENFHAEP